MELKTKTVIINKKLIQKLHDEYLKEARNYRKYRVESSKHEKRINIEHSNSRLYQGYESALYMVVNDLRYILELPMLEELENAIYDFGFIFNVE